MKGGDRGCPRGPDNEPHLLPHTYELPARFIVPAGACRPGLRPFRPSAAREGGAGRRGHPVPTVHVRKEKHKEVLPRGAGCSPASRTRCWWLAPRGPRWTDLPPCSGAHILSTAGGNLSPARPYSGYGKRHTRRPLVTHGRCAGHHAAWAAPGRVRYARAPEPPLPARTWQRVHAPLRRARTAATLRAPGSWAQNFSRRRKIPPRPAFRQDTRPFAAV